MIDLKRCKSCLIDKPKSEYVKTGKWLKGDCRGCISLTNKEHYYKDHEETKRKKLIIYHANKEKYKLNRILKERL